jgi:hypothetical protein
MKQPSKAPVPRVANFTKSCTRTYGAPPCTWAPYGTCHAGGRCPTHRTHGHGPTLTTSPDSGSPRKPRRCGPDLGPPSQGLRAQQQRASAPSRIAGAGIWRLVLWVVGLREGVEAPSRFIGGGGGVCSCTRSAADGAATCCAGRHRRRVD